MLLWCSLNHRWQEVLLCYMLEEESFWTILCVLPVIIASWGVDWCMPTNKERDCGDDASCENWLETCEAEKRPSGTCKLLVGTLRHYKPVNYLYLVVKLIVVRKPCMVQLLLHLIVLVLHLAKVHTPRHHLCSLECASCKIVPWSVSQTLQRKFPSSRQTHL